MAAKRKKKKKTRWFQISSDFSSPISKIIALVKSTIHRVVFVVMKRFDLTSQSEGKRSDVRIETLACGLKPSAVGCYSHASLMCLFGGEWMENYRYKMGRKLF